MEAVIKLPNVEAVQNFVRTAEKNECDVLVSKEGYKFMIDGTSIMGMMAVVGANIIVRCMSVAPEFIRIIETYKIV